MVRNNNLFDGLNNQIQTMTDQEARRMMEREGRKLKYIALKVWRKYLDSYQPKMYVRTRDTQRGIKLGRVKKLADGSYGIELTFENSLMYHDSVFGKNQPQGHSFMLISRGWTSKKLEKRIGRIPYFTHFKGLNLIGEIEREYNRVKDRTVRLETQWSGKYLK